MRIIVCNPLQDAAHSNGIAALAHLTKSLCEVGIEAYILPLMGGDENRELPIDHLIHNRNKNPGYSDILTRLTEQTNRFGLKLIGRIPDQIPEDVIVIYPETTTKNFLNASKVVRYLGARDGVFKAGLRYQVKNESIYTVSHSRLIDPDADYILFYPHIAREYLNTEIKPFSLRPFSTSYIGKGSIFKKDINHIHNTIEITRFWPKRKNEVAILLSNSKLFFTFDHWSNMTTEAILCGAIPVFIGNDPWPDFNIDAGELGAIPRLDKYSWTDIKSDFLDEFSQRRLEIINVLEEYQMNWTEQVAELCERLRNFFRIT
jgi:hypothetical protein